MLSRSQCLHNKTRDGCAKSLCSLMRLPDSARRNRGSRSTSFLSKMEPSRQRWKLTSVLSQAGLSTWEPPSGVNFSLKSVLDVIWILPIGVIILAKLLVESSPPLKPFRRESQSRIAVSKDPLQDVDCQRWCAARGRHVVRWREHILLQEKADTALQGQ